MGKLQMSHEYWRNKIQAITNKFDNYVIEL